jgi:hypothetical protein
MDRLSRADGLRDELTRPAGTLRSSTSRTEMPARCSSGIEPGARREAQRDAEAWKPPAERRGSAITAEPKSAMRRYRVCTTLSASLGVASAASRRAPGAGLVMPEIDRSRDGRGAAVDAPGP